MSHLSVVRPDAAGNYPIEPKVKAGTAASYALSLLAFALMTIVQDERVPLLIGFLPEWLEPFALAILPALGTLAAGFYAAHQHRRPLLPVSGSEAA